MSGALPDLDTSDDQAVVTFTNISGVPSLSMLGLSILGTLLAASGAILYRKRVHVGA